MKPRQTMSQRYPMANQSKVNKKKKKEVIHIKKKLKLFHLKDQTINYRLTANQIQGSKEAVLLEIWTKVKPTRLQFSDVSI